MNNIRNVAIIAHVDHGKTTLVDALLRQSKTHLSKEQVASGDLIMDSNDLERERGITIFSKNAAVNWQGTKINIIDTPGHADFGGEVERVLKMADGALLLVDAKEGPMPQTRFVLKKALELKLKIIVVINKVDKPDARPEFALNKTFDLFIELGADENAAYFPVLYAVGRDGKAGLTADPKEMKDISPVFDMIIKEIPAPAGDPTAPLQMLVTTIKGNEHKGRIATCRIYNGVVKNRQEVAHINREGQVKIVRITSLISFEGLDQVEIEEAQAGDIVAVAGIGDITIGETIADIDNPIALPLLSIEQPTVKMTFGVNASPFSGKEGKFTTSRQIRERLSKELETDMALRVDDSATGGEWTVSGRGELHLAILIERLRRENFELQVSKPQVIEHVVDGKKLVPYEQLFIEVPEQFSGIIMQKMGGRHGEIKDMRTDNGLTTFEFLIPTRGLLGYRGEFLTDTKGLGIMNSSFVDYLPDVAVWDEKDHGSVVAFEAGVTTYYGLLAAQDRGLLFIAPGMAVYKGQVVGESARAENIIVNVCKEKHLTNNRSKGEGVGEHFNQAKDMTIDDALEYIGDDELVEITPKTIRLRKKVLDAADAKRAAKGLV